MNSRNLLPVLAATVVVLVIAGVALTVLLIRSPVPEPPPPRPAAVPDAPRIAQTVMDLQPPAPPTSPKPQPASPRQTVAEPETLATTSPASPPADQQGIGKIAILVGQALAFGADGKSRTLSAESRVFLNDKIETQKGARIRIMLDDGTIIEQGEMSALVLDQYVCSQNPASDSVFAARIVKGLCRFITGLITKLNPDRVSVKTGMATIGVRGCDVAIRSATAGDSVYVLELSENEKVFVALAETEGTIPQIETVIDQPGMVLDLNTGAVSSLRLGAAAGTDKRLTTPRAMTQQEIRTLLEEVSPYPPAEHELTPGAHESVLRLKAPVTAPKQE